MVCACVCACVCVCVLTVCRADLSVIFIVHLCVLCVCVCVCVCVLTVYRADPSVIFIVHYVSASAVLAAPHSSPEFLYYIYM